MRIDILTIFPNLFDSFLQSPVLARCVKRGDVGINIIDIKQYAGGSFRHIDDSPFGGGAGMILRAAPILAAMEQNGCFDGYKILLTPKGTPYAQSTARTLAGCDHIVLLCGHYEGIDHRVEKYFDAQVSIGDFVLTGGELAAQVIVDSVVRLLPGAIRAGAADDESFEEGLLEYPQYTQPADLNGDTVPAVLRSGHRQKINDWRRGQALRITRQNRPDLFEKLRLTDRDLALLQAAEDDPV